MIDHAVELLAQAIWMRHFGVLELTEAWVDFRDDCPQTADELRDKARAMLKAAEGHKHHSLGWLIP
jgi:hypothetical protein